MKLTKTTTTTHILIRHKEAGGKIPVDPKPDRCPFCNSDIRDSIHADDDQDREETISTNSNLLDGQRISIKGGSR